MNNTPPIQVIKLANGRYRWLGCCTVNALDRDGEIFSEQAMIADVARTKVQGDDSILAFFHIVDPDNPMATRLGGAPDWRMVVNGHLLESGLFDDTVIGRGFAKCFIAHPEGIDGSGNAMSIGFSGYPDETGVFMYGVIKERSVLPRTYAAVPYTMFGVKGFEPVKEEQLKALETLKTLLADGDPETTAAANLIVAASQQSKALTEAGVQRKAASAVADAPAQTIGTGLQPLTFTTPGQYNVNVTAQTALGFVPAQTKTAANGSANAVPSAAQSGKVKAMDEAPPDEAPADPQPEETVADAPAEPSAEPSVEGDAPALSDADLMGIAKFIDARVMEMVTALKEEIGTALTAQLEAVVPKMLKAAQTIAADSAKDEVVKAYNEQPRGVFERLSALSASRSDSTTIDKSHNLFKPAPDKPASGNGASVDGMSREPDAVNLMKEYLGFRPETE